MGDEAGSALAITPATTPDSFCRQLRKLYAAPPGGDVLDRAPGADGGANDPPAADQHDLGFLPPQQSPAVLLIDGYQPEEPFAAWFERQFLDRLRQGSGPVLVIAEREPSLCGLRGLADEVLELGPLEEASVREAFDDLNRRGANPALTPDEIDAYVAASRPDPAFFGSLTRLLELNRSGAAAGTTGENRDDGRSRI